MTIDNLIGTWFLRGSTSLRSEIELIDGEDNFQGVETWLKGKSHDLINQLEPKRGLTLTITPDGRFTEEKTGNPQIDWYDQDGVLESEPIPFNGYLSIQETSAYLIPDDLPSWILPMNEDSNFWLRCDDGDTKISDSIEVLDNQLIRTVSVVTDELYLDRVVIVYQRAK